MTRHSRLLTLGTGRVTVEHSVSRQINTLLLQDAVHLPPVTPKQISQVGKVGITKGYRNFICTGKHNSIQDSTKNEACLFDSAHPRIGFLNGHFRVTLPSGP